MVRKSRQAKLTMCTCVSVCVYACVDFSVMSWWTRLDFHVWSYLGVWAFLVFSFRRLQVGQHLHMCVSVYACKHMSSMCGFSACWKLLRRLPYALSVMQEFISFSVYLWDCICIYNFMYILWTVNLTGFSLDNFHNNSGADTSNRDRVFPCTA